MNCVMFIIASATVVWVLLSRPICNRYFEYGYRECSLEVDARHYECVACLNGISKNDDGYCVDS